MYNNLIYFYRHTDFNVVVLQPKRDLNREQIELKKGIKTYYFREIRILGNNFSKFTDFNPFFLLKVRMIIKKHLIDLIHVEYPYGINMLRFIRKIPISYNSYNVEYLYEKEVGKFDKKYPIFLRPLYVFYFYLLEKFLLKFVRNINAVSKSDKKKLCEIYGISKNKIIVSPYGYRQEIINNPLSKDEARNRLKIDRNKFVVIFHGSYMYANQEAIDIIRNKIVPEIKDKDILFLIAGKIPRFKNKSNLKFLGFKDPNNLRDGLIPFIYTANIAIAPILRGSGVKSKIVDYLSAYLPVITTYKGGEGSFIRNGYNGYIVDNPINDIIEKIIFLKKNPNKLIEIKTNIEKTIKKNYIWEDFLKKVAIRYKYIILGNKKNN